MTAPAPPRWAPTPKRWAPPAHPRRTAPVVLSPRQAQVLAGMCQGLTNLAIANDLGLAEETVKTHVRRLYAALGAADRAHAVALAHAATVLVQERP